MTYLQMLRLKYGILNEADDEEDENKKKQNNEEEEEEEDEPDIPDDGGGEADTPDDGTEQQDTTEPETTGEEEEDEPDTPEGGDENLPAEQNDDVETGETDEDEPDVPDTGEENPEGGETTDDGGDMGDEEDEPDVPEGGEPAGDDGMGDTEGDTGEEGGGEEGETTDDGGEKSELQQAEEPLYQDLSDEQKNIRDKELKNNFVELNETLTTILERMNKVVKDTINIKIVDFVVNNLLKLKDMVCYYLTETFNTKSYQENMLFYQQCLVVMSSIQKLIPEITFEEEDTESK